MFEVGDGERRWGVTFFRTSSHIPYHSVLDLVEEATVMYISETDEMKVEHDDYRGRLYTRREYDCLGTFGGIVFYAQLETTWGDDTMKFLVSEQTQDRRLSFSLS